MGNTTSERGHGHGHGGGHGERHRDSSKGKEEHRSSILMDSNEDTDLFHADDPKGPEAHEFLAWQKDQESDMKNPSQNRPTMFRWTGGGKEVYLSGSFNNWATKIPLSRSQHNFVAVLDLPEGEHQYRYCVDGQWAWDPAEPMTVGKAGTMNNVIRVKKTDFEVFDALKTDSEKCADMSELSSSPPGPYHQDPYTVRPDERLRSPPILPPHLLQVLLNKDTGVSCDPALLPEPNHVMLNHLYALSIKDGVIVLSATHRYQKKYVTTLLYKPT
ncbi:5'-AMP-activated protein kinase subunit beta-1b [Alosa sapidissima]|uniref:5'-AMP-activated protein kinase subunit beta-1b n=1 Tax=Alosa sapidissima TaxID=34773 RepID=UPI001C0A5B32|nr:5'-AMP-activated protein kinase subunit beta-1b [Alosa sapidissima]